MAPSSSAERTLQQSPGHGTTSHDTETERRSKSRRWTQCPRQRELRVLPSHPPVLRQHAEHGQSGRRACVPPVYKPPRWSDLDDRLEPVQGNRRDSVHIAYFGLENIMHRRKQRRFQAKKTSISLCIRSEINNSIVSRFYGMQSKLIAKNIFF